MVTMMMMIMMMMMMMMMMMLSPPGRHPLCQDGGDLQPAQRHRDREAHGPVGGLHRRARYSRLRRRGPLPGPRGAHRPRRAQGYVNSGQNLNLNLNVTLRSEAPDNLEERGSSDVKCHGLGVLVWLTGCLPHRVQRVKEKGRQHTMYIV
jgi:hypothetical protein